MRRLVVSTILLLAIQASYGANPAPAPKPLETVREVTTRVQAVYDALRRVNAGIDKKTTAGLTEDLAKASKLATDANTAATALSTEVGNLDAEVDKLTELAKERPKRTVNDNDDTFAAKMLAYEDAKEQLPKVKADLEKKATEFTAARKVKVDADKLVATLTAQKAASGEIDGDNIQQSLERMQLQNTMQSLGLSLETAEHRMDVVAAHLDNAILGNYLQDKMEQLLTRPEFCKAARECTPDAGNKRQNLDSMFDGKRTHSK